MSPLGEITKYSIYRMLNMGMGPGDIIAAESRLGPQIMQLRAAAVGAELGAVAAGALPVIVMVGVFVALGAGYEQARELARAEESASGFSQGFVMGILGWEWRHVVDRFYRHGVIRINQSDEELNVIRVKSYDTGLKSGFLLGSFLPEEVQRAFVSGLRKLAGHPSAGQWTRNDQISLVISLATAYRRYLR
jgi:hypothetical protein